jgi:hypothetical protein
MRKQLFRDSLLDTFSAVSAGAAANEFSGELWTLERLAVVMNG